MLHTPEELLNLMLDDDLEAAEEADILAQIDASEELADSWQRLRLVDASLKRGRELKPPAHFTARVMQRVDAYERQRRWYPWLLGLLAASTLLSLVTIGLPAAFFAFGWGEALARWPAAAGVLSAASGLFSVVSGAAMHLTQQMLQTITGLTENPLALGVMLIGLGAVSIWIGLRESSRVITVNTRQA